MGEVLVGPSACPDECPPNVCVKCKHHKGPVAGGIWYDHYCGHPKVESKMVWDPVTGRHVWEDCHRHPHCRDINKAGYCDLFEDMSWFQRMTRPSVAQAEAQE